MVKIALDPLEAYREDLARYKVLTREEEQLYTREVRKVVLENPKIVTASDILLLNGGSNLNRYHFKNFGSEDDLKLEDLKSAAKKFLSKFNPVEGHSEAIEDWLIDRKRKTFDEFSDLDRYNASKRALVTGNLRMAYIFASKKRDMGCADQLIDLVQFANIGLERALLRFDPERGFRFLTYARHWVKRILSREMDKSVSGINLPDEAFEDLIAIRHFVGGLPDGKNLSRDEIEGISASRNGVARPRVGNVLPFVFGKSYSLNSLDDGGANLEGKAYDITEDDMVVTDALSSLNHRESEIIRAYYGIGEINKKFGDDPTLEKIAGAIGLTRSRVGQIVERALKKMKFFLLTKYPNYFVKD
jgi:RNA polymerase sigma factor (sigma-70 family)